MSLVGTEDRRVGVQGSAPEAVKPGRRVRRVGKYAIIAAAAALALLAAWWASQRPLPPKYLTAPVTRGTVARTVTATGTVNPVMTIIIGSYVSGVIRDVYCDYNTRVKKGQLCARIDPRPYQAALEQARGQLARDSAQLSGAKADLARYAVLLRQDSVARITYTDQAALVHQLEGSVRLDRALVSNAEVPPPNPYDIPPRITGYVNTIFVQAASPTLVPAALQQVTSTLMRRHHIGPGDTADFAVRNLSQIAQTAQGSSRIMALLLAVVASISLLVGGIGIMNILLVSVTERTREIGLRMAIGARRLHVLLQFLAESIFLSVTGGVAGILAGVGASALISAVAHWPTQLSAGAIGGGFVFSAAVGIFFGYYPARKAARLNPIEALRYE